MTSSPETTFTVLLKRMKAGVLDLKVSVYDPGASERGLPFTILPLIKTATGYENSVSDLPFGNSLLQGDAELSGGGMIDGAFVFLESFLPDDQFVGLIIIDRDLNRRFPGWLPVDQDVRIARSAVDTNRSAWPALQVPES